MESEPIEERNPIMDKRAMTKEGNHSFKASQELAIFRKQSILKKRAMCSEETKYEKRARYLEETVNIERARYNEKPNS